MAKLTKGTPAATGAPATPTQGNVVGGGINLADLTPEQLAALQKQLKEKRKDTVGKKEERFKIIDSMLQEKDEKTKEFRFTTRDIINNLAKNNLVDQTEPKWDQVEIKKVQSRKQHLEKLTDEKGNLVHKPNTFGYKVSSQGFAMTGSRVAEWFGKTENVKTLTGDQRNTILKALG